MDNKKLIVLVVDDASENIDVLKKLLQSNYKVKVALNGQKALQIAQKDPAPDLILLDIIMPEMDGYEVCRQLKSNITTAKIPVIFVTAKNEIEDESKGFDLGAVDYITKPISPTLLLRRVNTHLSLYNETCLLSSAVKERTKELNETRLDVILTLGRAAEYKDNETGMHVMRMSHYSQLLGHAIGLSEDECELLLNASPMHDLGKIGIPDHILLKPGKLDDAEWEIIKTHPQLGEDILGEKKSVLLTAAKDIALTHHEHWDGNGYPKGLKGEGIPLYGRICAIADVFDALTSERPYKKVWPVKDALSHIKENSGSHFDPSLVDKFMDIMPQILEIKERFAE